MATTVPSGFRTSSSRRRMRRSAQPRELTSALATASHAKVGRLRSQPLGKARRVDGAGRQPTYTRWRLAGTTSHSHPREEKSDAGESGHGVRVRRLTVSRATITFAGRRELLLPLALPVLTECRASESHDSRCSPSQPTVKRVCRGLADRARHRAARQRPRACRTHPRHRGGRDVPTDLRRGERASTGSSEK